jgi:hypothetical protein
MAGTIVVAVVPATIGAVGTVLAALILRSPKHHTELGQDKDQ